MDTLQTIIIAIVEGLTEFLPVSSTGHMIIAQALLGVESSDFVKAFTVIIQFGAILSVIVLYWKRFFKFNNDIPQSLYAQNTDTLSLKVKLWIRRSLIRYDFYVKLFIGFIPAAVLGFLFSDYIDSLLENVTAIAIALVLGGILMLFVDQYFNSKPKDDQITNAKAFMIGCFQCIAMIPGVSRSMSTIVGGMTQKLTRKTAAEFSFFLAVPTMAAATGYKLFKLVMSDGGVQILQDNMHTLLLGNVVAFVVAILAIKFFIGFVTKYGFKLFGWYRIILGLTILGIIFFTNINLTV